MFLDPSASPLVKELRACWRSIRDEALGLGEEDWIPFPGETPHEGAWTVFGLYHDDTHAALQAMCRRNAPRCPRVGAILARAPGLITAGFLRLGPRAHIHAHRDELGRSLIRQHLVLQSTGDAWLRAGDERRVLVEGECLGFRPEDEHEARNPSHHAARIVLSVDQLATAVGTQERARACRKE